MDHSVTRVTPDQLGYKDRGIVKWFGMMLSDHSEALKKEEKANQLIDIPAKEEMTEEEISRVLYRAFVTGHPVLIQANVLCDGNYYNDLQCKVVGYIGNKIGLFLKDGRSTSCTYEQIRNIAFMNSLDWYG